MKTAVLLIDLQNDYFPDGKFPLWNTDVTLANTLVISRAEESGVTRIAWSTYRAHREEIRCGEAHTDRRTISSLVFRR